MTIYFQGSELEALWPNPNIGTYNETTNVQATWSRRGSSQNGGDQQIGYLEADAGQEVNPFWYHDYLDAVNANVMTGGLTYRGLEIANGSDTVAFRIHNDVQELGQAQWHDGSSWNDFGDPFDFPHGGATWDIRIKIGDGTTTTDLIEVYKDEVLVASKEEINFLKENHNGMRYARRFSVPNIEWAVSQAIIANEPTLDWVCKTIVPTTDGTDASDGTGAIADVAETPIDNNTFIAFTAAGQRRSFKAPARTLSNKVKGFTVAGRVRLVEESSPNKIRPYIRPAGAASRYYGTTFTLSLGYENYQYTWQVNPETGVEWTVGQVNHADLEFGWEVVA